MRRRSFLGGVASAIVLAPMVGCRPWLRPDPKVGAITPHQRATVEAMAETFLPSTPDSPGAREARAVTVILDPAYPVAGYVAELCADVDDWCFVRHGGRAFVALTPAERERALEERLGDHGALIKSWYKPVYEGVLALTKLAFFGGLANAVGTTYVGFPGPSAGYAADSAAGVYAATAGTLDVAGAGAISAVRVTAIARGAVLRLTAPNGTVRELAVGDGAVVEHDLELRGPAAGTWRLDGAAAWWLALRTDRDEPKAAG